MEINQEVLEQKVNNFGGLCSKFHKSQEDKYRSYIESLSWLIKKSGYQCRVEVLPGKFISCSVCSARIPRRKLKNAHRLSCDHYICSIACTKNLLLKCWTEKNFDIGFSACQVENCQNPFVSKDILIKIFKTTRNLQLTLKKIVKDSIPTFDCNHCNRKHRITEKITLDCTHPICRPMMKQLLESSINDDQVESMACPECEKSIDFYIIKSNVSKHNWERFNQFLLSKHVDGNGINFQCPNENCDFQEVIQDLATDNFNCPSCVWQGCPTCFNPGHKGISCGKYMQWKEENRITGGHIDQIDQIAAKNQWKKCPHCKVWCEKIQGYNFMTCKSTNCEKRHFCYLCESILQAEDRFRHFFNEPFGNLCLKLK